MVCVLVNILLKWINQWIIDSERNTDIGLLQNQFIAKYGCQVVHHNRFHDAVYSSWVMEESFLTFLYVNNMASPEFERKANASFTQ